MDFTNLIIGTVTGFLTFLLGLQRGRKEVESLSLANLEKSVQIYQTIIEDLKKEIETLNDKVEKLQKKVDDMMVENHQLKMMLTEKSISS